MSVTGPCQAVGLMWHRSTAPEEANSHQLSLMTHRLLAVRQRFRNSPALLRRMGVGGHGHSVAPPSSGSGVVDDGGKCKRAARKSQSMYYNLFYIIHV